MIIGHGGIDLGIGKAIDMVNRQPNLYFDMCSPCNKKYGVVKLVAKECNPDKVLFGTDSPWNDPNLSVGSVMFSEVEDSIKRKWFRENFLKLYTRARKVLAP
jgi:predicted TIM-barrel fold metal-dependent hydrolase